MTAPTKSEPLPDGLQAHRLAERPELVAGIHQLGAEVWPRFMRQSQSGEEFYANLDSDWADCALAVVDPAGTVVCRVLWIPFAWDGTLPLPDRGWDWVIEQGIHDRRAGRPCTAASALEIGIHPDLRGGGLSGILLGHMRAAVAEWDATALFAPVRPSAKSERPLTSMVEYCRQRRPDGLPTDPWLRVHARAGGVILDPCERSMIISGSVADWQLWTGLDLSEPGTHLVPGALAPVISDGAQVVYTEPNVWVQHRVRG